MSADAAATPAPSRGRRRRGDADNFRLLADFAPVMIWVASPDRRCVYFNRPWIEFTGRDPEAELGFGWTEGLHPDDREATLAAYRQAFEARQPFEAEFRLRRRDGEYRWLIDKGVPIVGGAGFEGFVGSCLDITDRMVAERAARKREQDFTTLAENIPDFIARLDRDLKPVYLNRPLDQAFGGSPPGLAEAAARAFASGAEQTFGFQSGADGERRHFEGRVIPERDAAGHIEAALAIVYDVTARAREDERRAEILERERSARASAESATMARDQFLAVVSHELRSPLNGIKSWTHVLESQIRDPDPTVRRALAGIMIGVEHQVRLIEDLLDMTRAMSGNLALAKQPMPLLPVLAEAVESLRASADEKDLRIVADYGAGDLEIHGDPERIRQVFANLIANAVKFTPPGGHVWVNVSSAEGMARVDIRDDGAGVPPEFLPYLFDPFRQADQATNRRSQSGLGMGLALVQRLAQLHGGYVTCESEGVGRGATFRVHLPLPRETGARVIAGDGRPGEAAGALPSLAGVRVLLIDDQREARESVAALLAQRGASVATAASCQEALAHLAMADETEDPEIIVCDIAMPGEDGYATLKRIRAWEAGRGARGARRPAVALSAFTQREDRLRALSEGFQMHLTKPVAPVELITVVSSVARGLRA